MAVDCSEKGNALTQAQSKAAAAAKALSEVETNAEYGHAKELLRLAVEKSKQASAEFHECLDEYWGSAKAPED